MTPAEPDAQIGEFLSKIVGCDYTFHQDIKTDAVEVSIDHQVARSEGKSADYVDGISQTLRMGLTLRPMILARIGRTRFRVLDGVHRFEAYKAQKCSTFPAYVLVDATPDQEKFIASTVNVWLNGQGLSEAERRRHFIDYLRQETPELSAVDKALRSKYLKRVCLTLSISAATARRWTDVEVFKERAKRLGLDLPPERIAGHNRGERTDGWILKVAQFTDEELKQYWRLLIGANHSAIHKVAKELDACTSSREREAKGKVIFQSLHQTMRAISQTKADQDRGKANRIRMHGAGLIKMSGEFAELAARYADVGQTLVQLNEVLQKFIADSNGLIDAARSA